MSDIEKSTKYYSDDINLKDVKALEVKLKALVQYEITSEIGRAHV